MAITNSTNKHIRNGNGITRDWDYTFAISTTDGSDITVYKIDADGVVTQITANYDVDVAAQHVTYPTVVSGLPLLQTGESIILLREVDLSQSSVWKNQGPFNAETVEDALDKLTMITQQQKEEISRCIKTDVSTDEEETAEALTEDLQNAVAAAESAETGAEAAQTKAETAQEAAEAAQAAAEAAQAGAIAARNEAELIADLDIDTDGTMAENSDTAVPSQKATKTYVDTRERCVVLKVIADDETLVTGDGQVYFTVPAILNGMNLISAHAHVYTASSSGTPTVQVHNLTDAVDMLSTRITIDANEGDSEIAAVAPVIDTDHDDVATKDVLRIDIDVAGTGTKGMEIRLTFQLP